MKKGKKIIFLLLALSMIGTTVTGAVVNSNNVIVSSANEQGWDDCYKNEHCGTKKKCGRYVDTNKDKYCDHGQENPKDTVKKVSSTSKKSSGGCNGDCLACGACV